VAATYVDTIEIKNFEKLGETTKLKAEG